LILILILKNHNFYSAYPNATKTKLLLSFVHKKILNFKVFINIKKIISTFILAMAMAMAQGPIN